MDPHDLLDSVNDESSFLAFARALLADRIDEVNKELASPSSPYGPGENGWENGTIERFLEAQSLGPKQPISAFPKG